MAHEAATNTTNMEQSRPKAKKRKTLPFETDFIEADLMWFKDKRAVDSPTNLQEVHIADLSTAEPTSTDGVPRSVSEKPTETSPLAAKTSDIANPPSNKQSPTILSAQGTQLPNSRSPSSSLRVVVRSGSSGKTLTGPTTEDGKSIAGPQAAPGSPVILGPSITRREPTSASPDTSSHSPEKALSVTGEALPSPLPTKRSKKRKRGPPGLKILPVISTGSPGENLALGDSISTSIATGELVETLNSTPVPPQRPLANVAESRADHSVEAGEPIASSHAFEGTVTTVDSPVAMDADELVRSVDVIARGADTTEGPVVPNGEGRSSGDVEMRDPASSTSSQAPVSPLPLFLPSSSQSSLYTPSIRPFELDISTSTTTLTANSSSSSIDTQAMVTIEDRVAESLPKTEIPVKTSTTTAPAPAALPVEQPDPQTPFANTSARVLSMVRGASSMTPASHPVVGDFELTADELVQIARWNDRTKLSDDLSKTLCISFVSYLVSQCIDASAGEPQEVSNVDECGPLASWPQDGTAFVVVNDGQGADRFTVSPPFMTTIDKCIDLGTRGLRAGPNTLHLFQYRDHSDRFFVVILHHPTRAQLMELQNARNKAREWQRFVEGLGRIELHVPRLFPSPALNGNFVSHG
ncbi:hypothetical protein C8Q79DRAFT_1007611 [Trametes meyenii]|nr:hypothetical protein C8Q79DRAFT_1007611 [Trametes meyenii]